MRRNLTYFSVANNQLTGAPPASLTALSALTSATWASNCITGVASAYSGCDMAERPVLGRCGIVPCARRARECLCRYYACMRVFIDGMGVVDGEPVDFFAATNTTGWTSACSSGWMTSAHPCSWAGVACLGGSKTSGPVVYVFR